MIALIQRVSHAQVVVDDAIIGKIERGILALIGVEKEDDECNANRLLTKLLGYRIFPDQADKMNLSLTDVKGELLLVPQFTLSASTKKGLRPSFSSAAAPQLAEQQYNYFVQQAKQKFTQVATGRFGADMKVSLCNDGPVTFWLQG